MVVTNSEDCRPVYVRARAFSGDAYQLLYSGEGWSLGSGGYYYYDQILYSGEDSAELLIRSENIPEDSMPGDYFNIAVIYETTLVLYDEDGNPYADWSLA